MATGDSGRGAIEMRELHPEGRNPTHSESATQRQRVPLTTQKSRMDAFGNFSKSVQKSLADFFLGEEEKDVVHDVATKWRARCVRLHSNRLVGGKVKEGEITGARSIDTLDNSVFEASLSHGDDHTRNLMQAAGRRTPQPYDPLHKPRRQMSRSSKGSNYGMPMHRQYSHVSTASSSRRSMRAAPSGRNRKSSVLAMVYGGMTGKGSQRSRKPRPNSRSFAPGSISNYQDDCDSLKSPAADSLLTPGLGGVGMDELDDVFFNSACPTSPLGQSTAHPLARAVVGGTARVPPDAAVTTAVAEELPTIQERSRISEIREELPSPTSLLRSAGRETQPLDGAAAKSLDSGDGMMPPTPDADKKEEEVWKKAEDGVPEMRETSGRKRGSRPPPLSMELAQGATGGGDEARETLIEKPMKGGWQKGRVPPEPIPGTPDFLGADYVDSAHLVDQIDGFGRAIKEAMTDWDNSDRREIGKGFVGNLFDREYIEQLPSEIEEQIEDMVEHRPYFTYWATFVQITIYFVAVAVYGIAPLGFEETEISGEILKPSLAIEKVSYFEHDNLWIGPRQADLIHLGARYSPCMRADDNVIKAIEEDRAAERQTACCIRNDGSGCHQTSLATCSSTLSYWQKWGVENPGPENRTSGSVCGQNPLFCKEPISSGAYLWPDDITKWPICTDTITASTKPENMHMNCELKGRPCCVGIQGACIITTREYCAFRKGYFHEEATLCSQISCMSEICGMIPFRNAEVPDQFYRLWTSLFLHAGLFQLLVSVLFQYFVMRDVEKLAGWFRTAIIYIGSGIAGSLASATFLPYHVEAGPAGSQFGIIACLFAELFQNWGILKHPCLALLKQLAFLLVLFLMGLLPYVDNYAHLFGFVFGFLLSFALLPFIKLNSCDRRGKCVGVIICLLASIGLFSGLIVLFYVSPIYSCPYCHYFNCIPITSKFCQTMEVKIGRHEIY